MGQATSGLLDPRFPTGQARGLKAHGATVMCWDRSPQPVRRVTPALRSLRLDEIEALFDAVEAVVHPIKAQAHLSHFPRHVGDAALD